MSQNQSKSNVSPSRLQAELERVRDILSSRNQQLQNTEQQLNHSEEKLQTTVRGYRQVLCLLLLALLALIAIVVGGAA